MKKSWKAIFIPVLILALLAMPFLFLREYIANYSIKIQLKDIKDTFAHTRLLVFAPHNDDEILGAGELIAKVIRSGGEVKVVLMTNGDGFKTGAEFDYRKLDLKPADYIRFGYLRQQETIRALTGLGVDKDNIIFLGYPDGGLSRLWDNYWDAGSKYYDPLTQVNESPYDNSFTKNASYCGESVVSDIGKIIVGYQPDLIVCPDPNDAHPDHWSTYCFVKYAETAIKFTPAKEWLYLVHQEEWPAPMKRRPRMYLVPPAQLAGSDTVWMSLPLTPDEVLQKERSIKEYKSQTTVLHKILFSFVRRNELFGVLPSFPLGIEPDSTQLLPPDPADRVISSPLQYYTLLQIDKSAAVSAVYATLSENADISVIIEMKGDIKDDIDYRLGLILFGDQQATDLRLTVRAGKIAETNLTAGSTITAGDITSSRDKNFLAITIPAKGFPSLEHLFLNVMTTQGSFKLDRTAWRMIDITDRAAAPTAKP